MLAPVLDLNVEPPMEAQFTSRKKATQPTAGGSTRAE